MGPLRISILIRTLNEAEHLGSVLDAVLAQETAAHEVLVLDSGSTDDTRAITEARPAPVRFALLDVPFTYGRALNRGIEMLDGDVLVFLSGHARPVDSTWLGELVAPLADASVAAVYGRQIPHDDCPPWEANAIHWAYGPEPRRQTDDSAFSNVNAAVLRTRWEQCPFDEDLPYSEDRHWAAAVQAHGLAVSYAPRAAVYHSHDEPFATIVQRTEKETRAAFALGTARWEGTLRGLWRALRAGLRQVRRTVTHHRCSPRGLIGGPVFELARFEGRRRAARGVARQRS